MNKIFFLITFNAFLCLHAFSQECINKTNKTSPFKSEILLRHLEALSSDVFEGRRTGTKGSIKAQNYIVNQFYSLGVLPLKKSYKQRFQFKKGRNVYEGTNVLGVIKGTVYPQTYIVISAHYDHEGIKNGVVYNGADDNASGVSALFSFAEYFKTYPPKHSVILVAFDAEELGMFGSKFYINNFGKSLNKIKINLNMDMISRNDKNELFVVGANEKESLKTLVLSVKSTKNTKLVIGHDGTDRKENWMYASDHVNFYRKGIPFLYFGVEDHEDYHEPTDDFENIHPKFYIDAVRSIISVFEKIDDGF